jgi:cysteine-rich repeat protein
MTLKDDQGNELGEDDDGGTSLCSKFDVPDDTFAKLGPGTYDLEITEFSGGSISSFDLVLEAYEADVCGNEIVEPGEGELCDDGNTLNGDDCTSQCQPDRTFAANPGTSTTFSAVSIGIGELVPVGITVTSTIRLQVETFEDSVAGTCPNIDTEASFRNDDYVEVAYDDDGGVDLCSLLDPAVDTDLVLFPGDYVVEIYDNGRDDAITVDIVLDALAPSCGDGIRLGAEQCDDGNTTAGDGCDASCDFEISGTFSATAMNSVTFTGESIAVGAIRVYEIDVPSGPAQTVEVETFSDAAAGTCTGIDTVVRLYDDAGAELGTDDDDGLSLCSLIDASDAFSTLQTGTYYLSVEEYLKNSAITYDIVFDVP